MGVGEHVMAGAFVYKVLFLLLFMKILRSYIHLHHKHTTQLQYQTTTTSNQPPPTCLTLCEYPHRHDQCPSSLTPHRSRQSTTDKVASNVKPDSQKGVLEQGSDTVKGAADSVAGSVQPGKLAT